eukprot:768105-Hanusia_phi.AAC.2
MLLCARVRRGGEGRGGGGHTVVAHLVKALADDALEDEMLVRKIRQHPVEPRDPLPPCQLRAPPSSPSLLCLPSSAHTWWSSDRRIRVSRAKASSCSCRIRLRNFLIATGRRHHPM